MGSALWEQKNENVAEKIVGRCFFCGHLRNCSRLSKHCTKPAFEDEMYTKEDQITATISAMVAVAAADKH